MRKFKKVGWEKGYNFVVWRHANHQGTRENVYKIEYKFIKCSNIAGEKTSDLAAAERIIHSNYALLPYMVWDKAKNYCFNVTEMWPLAKKAVGKNLYLQNVWLGKEIKERRLKQSMTNWALTTDVTGIEDMKCTVIKKKVEFEIKSEYCG